MPDIQRPKALVTVFASGLLVSGSFLINGGRTEWYMLKLLYRLFGDVVLSEPGFLFAGTLLYLLLWASLSILVYVLLRALGNQASFGSTFSSSRWFLFATTFSLSIWLIL